MKKEVLLTQESYDELKRELEYMKTEGARNVAEAIKEARGYGDLSENSEYDEAKNEQGKLYSRIAELEAIIPNAIIIDDMAAGDKGVTIGSTVTVVAVANGMKRSFKIVGSQEADAMNGIISDDSPFGKALVGAKEGDTVTVEAPRGAIKYTVTKIER